MICSGVCFWPFMESSFWPWGPVRNSHIRWHQFWGADQFHPDKLKLAQFRCEALEQAMSDRADLVGLLDPDVVPLDASKPNLQWAVDYFVSAWMSRSGSAGCDGEFNSGLALRWSSNGGDSAVRFRNAVDSLPAWRKVLRKCSFTTMDALKFLERCQDQKGHAIYCDPPFPGPGDRYRHKVDEAFQRDLSAAVSRFTVSRVAMRFYDHPLIRHLYPESRWKWLCAIGRNSANGATP